MKKRLKMYKQTVLLFIVLIVLAFATNVFFYAYNLNQIMRYRTTQIEQSSAFLGNQIGTQISYIHQYCRDILRRPELKTLETQNAQDAPWEYYSDVNDLLYKMNNSAVAGNFVEDSLLLLKNSDMVLSAKNGLSKWKESALQSSFENVDAVTRLQVQKIGGELYLFDFPQIYVRTAKFENLDTVLCIQLNQNVFVQYIKGYLSSDLVSMEFLQGDDPALLAYQIEQPRNTKLYELEQTISGTQQRLKLKFAIPMYGYSFMILSVLITVCFLLTIIGAVYYVNRMNVVIHKPIRKIIKAFKDVETGCYDVQLSGHETEEFSYLYEAIGNIVTQLKTSIETQYEQRLALQNSEIKQYQLQINPHFLYNGFYNIQRMCTNGQYDKAVLLSKRLASYYRYITRNGISFVPLAEEVRHMEDYIDIQSIRFQDRICIVRNYHLQDMPAVQVPRLIFQPILENVYEHAFNTVETNGLITITMQTDEKMLHCTIEDSGEGMPKDKMDELNAWLSQDSGYTECTGILNVNKRLKLHYGRQSGILYAAGAQGCGVKIEMRICFENKGGEANV